MTFSRDHAASNKAGFVHARGAKRREVTRAVWSSLFLLAAFLGLLRAVPAVVGDTLQDNHSDFLVLTRTAGKLSRFSESSRKEYFCSVRNLWTKERMPINYPSFSSAWDNPLVWGHQAEIQLWAPGALATPGIEKFVEDSDASGLMEEFRLLDLTVPMYNESAWYIPLWSGRTFFQMPPLKVSSSSPTLSSIAKMYPSPDWFTGFYGLNLIDNETNTWYDHLKIQTYPWKAGTDSSTGYTPASSQSDINPPEATQRISHDNNNVPSAGELLGPDGVTILPVSEWECFLVV